MQGQRVKASLCRLSGAKCPDPQPHVTGLERFYGPKPFPSLVDNGGLQTLYLCLEAGWCRSGRGVSILNLEFWAVFPGP